MKLLCAPASPFSSKVRMAARHLGLDIKEIRVDTNAGPAILTDNNPLGKIPTLIADDGLAIFDSRAIMHYFGRLEGSKLYPAKEEKRVHAEVLEALCDGTCDSLLAIVYERRFHPEDKQHQPWIDRQWSKVVRVLDRLETAPPKIGKKLNGSHFAVAAMIGYLQLRFAGQWEEDRGNLVAWIERFEETFPDYASLKPHG
ncbi:glutathione S-transferase [Rhizobium sp. RAF56]|jgi:glutathione S-transferase|uniref:glutathione S-transferase n=1 Tax=Rhizobium sp. RAF56 TaxID=3233062 RepID=UPI003F9D9406